MAETTGRRKRPAKKDTINFIMSQYALINSGVPGYTTGIAKVAMNHGDLPYFLYKGEIEKLLEEKLQDNKDFDAQGFVTFLQDCDAIQEGAAPRFGEGQLIRINSMERALEVANDPKDAEVITQIMTEMVALRDKLKPLVDKHASCSIALKNNKKDEEVGSGEPVDTNENPSEDMPVSAD